MACALLTACGGGNDDESSKDYSSKYVGTWTTTCAKNGEILDLSTNQGAYSKQTVTFTRSSDTVAKGKSTTTVYASTDTSCTQAALGTIVWNDTGNSSYELSSTGIISGLGATLTIDGQTTVGDKTVDKITLTNGALAPGLTSNGSLSFGGKFSINPNDFSAESVKTLAYVNGSTLTFGDDTGSDTTYPSGLDATAVLTKQ